MNNSYGTTYEFKSTPYITGTLNGTGDGAAKKIRTRIESDLRKNSNAPITLAYQYYLRTKYASTRPGAGHYFTCVGVKRTKKGNYYIRIYDTFNKAKKKNGKVLKKKGKIQYYSNKYWQALGTKKGQMYTLTQGMYKKNYSSKNRVFIW